MGGGALVKGCVGWCGLGIWCGARVDAPFGGGWWEACGGGSFPAGLGCRSVGGASQLRRTLS